MPKNPLIRKVPKMTGQGTGGHKSAGILDDFAVRKTINSKEGTVEKVPVNDSDIANKKYVDDQSGGVTDHGALTGLADDDHTQYILADGTRNITGNFEIEGALLVADNSITPLTMMNTDANTLGEFGVIGMAGKNSIDAGVGYAGIGFKIEDPTNATEDGSLTFWTITNGAISEKMTLDSLGNLAIIGTIDGRNIATDGTKLDTIETNATIDQTKGEIDALGLSHDSLVDVSADDHHAQSHTIVSHSDTTATGAELDELTNGSETTLHSHAGGASASPSGSIIMFGNSTAPTDWLNCDGTAISRTTYATLFGVIGTTYGIGNGSTTFNIPDMRGAFPRGAGTSTQFTQDHTTTLGTYEDDSMQGHKHNTTFGTDTIQPSNPTSQSLGTNFTIASSTPITDGINGTPRTANETRPNNLGVNFIIKT